VIRIPVGSSKERQQETVIKRKINGK
jgi:hypothetical protein